jgi:2-polyprenyl-3-methyl-5-hydroxy-6-metoxy-1,4-benzoquinol methylase
MTSKYKELENCLCCGNDNLRTILDLGEQPLANNSLKTKEEPEDTYPLKLNFCNQCTHLQLQHAVDPNLMFRQYLYVTGTGQTIKDYLKWFADFTGSYVTNNNKKVLDIACNDGTLLDFYKELGYETYGIDPSENLYEISSKKHTIECDFLNREHAKKYKDFFSTVIAQNVMAHNSYPKEFLEIARDMVTEDGLIFVQNSQTDMIKNNEFDTIYHEHISFYSIESFRTLARSAGLKLIGVLKTEIHGNSDIFVLSKNPSHAETKIENRFLLNDDTIDEYSEKSYEIIQNLKSRLNKIKSAGYKIVGYGAAAKGNTLINASGIELEYIVDETPLKQGLYTPGARIPIVPPTELSKETDKICVVPLAWNFFEELKKKSLQYSNVDDIIFVRYFPEFKVEE